MRERLTRLGYALVVIGLIFAVAGGVTYTRVQDGYDSLKAFSEVQNVELSYNEEGQLTDRGTTEGADTIKALLTDEWQYPVVEGDLDPNDPLVNTGTEYMYQMATVVQHTIHGTQTVVLDEAVEYDGETFDAGTYEVDIDGKYWADFDRAHPLEGPARGQAWTGTVHGLVGELGVGTVTHSTLQMGLALAGTFAGLGAVFILTGLGLAWAAKKDDEITFPDTVPDALLTEPKVEVRT